MKPTVKTRQQIPAQQDVRFAPEVQTLTPTWPLQLVGALAKDAGTYGLMAMGYMLEKAGRPQWASQCYQLGSRFNPLFFHLLGDAFIKQDPARALGYYQAFSVPQTPALLKKQAKAYSQQQAWEQAANCLERVFEQQPDDLETLYHLAEIYTLQGEWFRTLYYCKEGLAREPRNATLWGHMGYALYRLADLEGSLKAYQTALQYGMDNHWKSQVAQTIGQLNYQNCSDLTEALGYFKQAVQLNPGNADALEMLGEVALKQGQMEDALIAYHELMTATPGRSDVYCALGYVLWQLDRNEEAVDAYLAAIQLDSHNAVAMNNLGVIYLDEEKNAAKALGLFQQAFTIQPDYTLARFNQGRCLQACGYIQDAAKAYGESLLLNRQHPELDENEIQNRLNDLFVTEH